MRAQVTIEFGLSFFIIFTMLVLLIFATFIKIDSITESNDRNYRLVKCYQKSDYIIEHFSTNPNEINLTAVKNYVIEEGDFMTLANSFRVVSFGNYTQSDKVSVRRIVIMDNVITTMDLVCNS